MLRWRGERILTEMKKWADIHMGLRKRDDFTSDGLKVVVVLPHLLLLCRRHGRH